MEKSVFDFAAEYNFDAIKEYVGAGNPINVCDGDGNSLLTAFLAGYVEHGDITEDQEELRKEDPEGDYGLWISFLSTKHKTPLAQRSSKIVEQLEWFLNQGASLDLCDLSKCGMVDTPLVVAVHDEDYYLTEYLLEHGADPKVWLFDDRDPGEQYETYLIDHMDISLLDSKGERFGNLCKIAALLVGHGFEDYGGHCIEVDKESRMLTCHNLRPRY